MSAGVREIGDFCWINMLTPKPEDARPFFAELLGWTYGEIPGVGHLIKVQRHDIGGLFDLQGINTPPGTPPCIGIMVKVATADSIVERVAALGGTAGPAFDISENGRMAVCFDPNGANIDVWEAKKQLGTAVDSGLHGAPSWFENLTTDPARAAVFYSELFDWKPETMTMPNGAYTVFKLGEASIAGMMSMPPAMAGTTATAEIAGTAAIAGQRPFWSTYFTVTDADSSAHAVSRLGGTITTPVHAVPGVGRSFGAISPQGVAFHAIQYAR